jgi:hypothetical protein
MNEYEYIEKIDANFPYCNIEEEPKNGDIWFTYAEFLS